MLSPDVDAAAVAPAAAVVAAIVAAVSVVALLWSVKQSLLGETLSMITPRSHQGKPKTLRLFFSLLVLSLQWHVFKPLLRSFGAVQPGNTPDFMINNVPYHSQDHTMPSSFEKSARNLEC